MYEYLFERGQLIRDASPAQYTNAVLIRCTYSIQFPTPAEEDLTDTQWASLREYNTRSGSTDSWIGHETCQFANAAAVEEFTRRTGVGWV